MALSRSIGGASALNIILKAFAESGLPNARMFASSVKLCPYCATLAALEDGDAFDHVHHSSYGVLKQSSESCGLCMFILLTLNSKIKGQVLQASPRPMERDLGDDCPITLDVTRRHALNDGLVSAEFTFTVESDARSFSDCVVISACEVSSNAANRAIWQRCDLDKVTNRLDLVAGWINDCSMNHEECQPARGLLPKRLISIGKGDAESAFSLRLVNTADLDAGKIHYSTVSHCWGTKPFIKTTRETITEFLRSIPLAALPRTFQDAIEVSHRVGIHFIWIDSLCISQGDSEEWQSESAKMADVFQGSALTIAATDSPSSQGGCFLKLKSPVELSEVSTSSDYNPATLFMRHPVDSQKDRLVRLQATSVLSRVNQSALNSRGWVMQEMVLSRRLLHCTRHEFYWKCRWRCESELGMTYEATSRSHRLPRLRHDSLHEASETWYQWIRNYTPRSFSLQTDRIPAVAGITKFFQGVTGDVPMLGLWKSTLGQDLEWRAIPGTRWAPPLTPQTQSRLPSWSWFSCPFHVDFGFGPDYHWDTGQTVSHLRLVKWRLTWTAEPLTSSIAAAELSIRAPLLRVHFVPIVNKGHVPYGAMNALATLEALSATESDQFCAPCHAYFDDTSPDGEFQCLSLLLRTTTGDEMRREVFLLLQPVDAVGKDSSSYRRIGIGCISTGTNTAPFFDPSSEGTIELL